jgi:uncharacterized membrane protein
MIFYNKWPILIIMNYNFNFDFELFLKIDKVTRIGLILFGICIIYIAFNKCDISIEICGIRFIFSINKIQ